MARIHQLQPKRRKALAEPAAKKTKKKRSGPHQWPVVLAQQLKEDELPYLGDLRHRKIRSAILEVAERHRYEKLNFDGRKAMALLGDRLKVKNYSSKHDSRITEALFRLNSALQCNLREHPTTKPVDLRKHAIWLRRQLTVIRASQGAKPGELVSIRPTNNEQSHIRNIARLVPEKYCQDHDNDVINQLLLGAFKMVLHYHISNIADPESQSFPTSWQYLLESFHIDEDTLLSRSSYLASLSTDSMRNPAAPSTICTPTSSRKRTNDEISNSSAATTPNSQRPKKKLRVTASEQDRNTTASAADAADLDPSNDRSSSGPGTDESSASESGGESASQEQSSASESEDVSVSDEAPSRTVNERKTSKAKRTTEVQHANDLSVVDTEGLPKKFKHQSTEPGKEPIREPGGECFSEPQSTSTADKQAQKTKKSKGAAAKSQTPVRNTPAKGSRSSNGSKKQEQKGKDGATPTERGSRGNPSTDHAALPVRTPEPGSPSTAFVIPDPMATEHQRQMARIRQHHAAISPPRLLTSTVYLRDEAAQQDSIDHAQSEYFIDKNGNRRRKSVMGLDVLRELVGQRDDEIEGLKKKLEGRKQKVKLRKQEVQLARQEAEKLEGQIEFQKRRVKRRDDALRQKDVEIDGIKDILKAMRITPVLLAEIQGRMKRGRTAREALNTVDKSLIARRP